MLRDVQAAPAAKPTTRREPNDDRRPLPGHDRDLHPRRSGFLSSPQRARQGNWIGAAGMALAIVVTLAAGRARQLRPDRARRWRSARVVGAVGARTVQDDRDAADGGPLQRRRRRRGRADRARRSSTRAAPGELATVEAIAIRPFRADRRRLVRGLAGRVREAAGADQRPADRLPGQKFVNAADLGARALVLGVLDLGGRRASIGCSSGADRGRARVRRPLRAADRRRGHAGRDLAAERVHRARRRPPTGFVLHNNVLIVAGALVGASGTLLTILMGQAMNRSLANVLFGAFGSVQAGSGRGRVDDGRSVRTDVAGRRRRHARVRAPGRLRPGLRPRGRAGAARRARARATCSRRRASTSATRSIPSPVACRGT